MSTGRVWRGFGWGVVATVAMSLVMIIGLVSGMSPMPKPIPAAIVGKITGGGLPQPALMAIAAILHLGYGGFWGAVLASVSERVTIWQGVGLGVALWLIMQLAVLPYLGWGVFGTAQTPKIAVATLVLHLIYGLVLGWQLDRETPEPVAAGEPPAERSESVS